MKKIFFSLLAVVLLTGCVTQKKYNELLNDYLNSEVKNKFLNQSLDSLKTACATKDSSLTAQITQLQADSASLAELIESMQKTMEDETAKHALAQQEYLKKLKEAGDKTQKTNADLIQMQVDLEKQKMALEQKEADLKKAYAELQEREKKIAELQQLLTEQKTKSEALKEAIKKALTDFSAGELSVYTKDGKVYVSMSDKLLFKSGSTTVESKGVEALGKLSEVLKKNADILITIEGHTDNVPYISSGGLIKDNWDLSLMRSSSVLHILTDKYKVNPVQIIASGRGEFSPISSNATADGKARNRRTEIIITPKVDKLLQMMEH
ncbi:MAG TPA: OmpA family protein [Chitinophagales bacterium]|jgi:chemotaxis protein MotB|nr:OmpA family protein [Chitinophagales bacterium]HQO89203.1 OmpA family protein [Chitinophagales bacterium]